MRVLAGVVSGVLLLAGCTTAEPTADPASSAAPQPDGGAAAAEAFAPEAMPSPEAIAPQWTIEEEPEGGSHAEEGSASDWLVPRDPAELVWGLGALGCPQTVGAERYPLAAAAQQGRYRTEDGNHAVALQLRFDEPAQAAELLSAMGQDAEGCVGPEPDALGGYERRYTVTTTTPDALQVSFREFGPGTSASTWHVLGAHSDGWVGLFYVERTDGSAAGLPDPAVLLPGD